MYKDKYSVIRELILYKNDIVLNIQFIKLLSFNFVVLILIREQLPGIFLLANEKLII